MLSSGMDGIHKEENAPVLGMESINMHDPPLASLQEVASHLVASTLTRQLFELPVIVPARLVYMKPPQDPILVALNSSPHVEASNTTPSDDEFLTACLQAFNSKHATLAS
jgi:hypothetical protein